MTTKYIFLTTTGPGSLTIPEDFDPANNSVSIIAAGADGTGGGTNTSGAAGGGGQWAGDTNLALTPGSRVDFHIGVHGGTSGTPSAVGTADTWLGTPATLFAQGAAGNVGGNYTGGSWSKHKGGNTGGVVTSSDGGGHGGGGAGGPNGDGQDGGQVDAGSSALDTGGGGGGAANGGSVGAPNDSSTGKGGKGGDSRASTGGGLGGLNLGHDGEDGEDGGGAGGGGASDAVSGGGKGGKGSTDPVWGARHGPGSGGGGGGGPWASDNGGDGGDAGGYGGGGGAGGARGPTGGPTQGGLGSSGLIVIAYEPAAITPPILPPAPSLSTGPRVSVLLRIATDPVIRLWSGMVRDIAIPSGGAETTDGALYQSMGLLTGLPQLSAALNGDAERVEFSISGAAVTGEVATIAASSAPAIRGVAVDVGLVLFDADWQVSSVFWAWSGTADSLTVERSGDIANPTRTLKLSAGNVFTGRRRYNLSFFTDIDQKRRSADDTFFDQVANLQDGATKVWGTG